MMYPWEVLYDSVQAEPTYEEPEEPEAPPPDWLLSDEEAVNRLEEIKVSHPNNRAAKFFSRYYYESLSPENRAALIRCVRSGTYNPSSSVGCYAMRPEDYDTLRGFFAPLISDYHGVRQGAMQLTDWDAPPMDLASLGLGPSSSRVRVGRNLANFPLPGAMTKEQRCEMEEVMSKAFAELARRKLPDGTVFGGRYYSLSPGRAETIDNDEYSALIKQHLMFKDMADDPYLNTAGISGDWPFGRGTYISANRRVSIWCNEEDHLRVTVLCHTTSLNEPFDLLNATLKQLESIPGVKFKRSEEFGYVTSCPSNLGTGMRASIHIQLPELTADSTTDLASAIAKPFGLSVRGTGGEHTPVQDNTVDISPSARFGITEHGILRRLYFGIKAIMAEEKKITDGKEAAKAAVLAEAAATAAAARAAEAAAKSSAAESTTLKVIIAGAPASGKGTQCELIVAKYGLMHLSTGDLLRAEVAAGSEAGLAAKAFMEAGNLVPDEVIISMVKNRLAQPDAAEKGWLLDGFPRAVSQAVALESAGIRPDVFLLLDVPDDFIVERVVGRRLDPDTGKIYHLKFAPPPEDIVERLVHRSDDTEEKCRNRLGVYHDNVNAVRDSYTAFLRNIDGNRDKHAVFADIETILDGIKASGSLGSAASRGLLSDEEAVNRLEELKVSHPNNRAAKFFSRQYYESLSPENRAALIRCMRSGTYNPSSSVGCYAMRPEDYDTLRGFFAPLISDYHGVPEGAGQPTDWDAQAMDIGELGLGSSSCRVRVGRNLASFPLPGAMTKEQRCEMEEVMSKAYAELASMEMPNGQPFGGRYYSLTPGRPDSIDDEQYKELIKEHLMFKDMADDPYLNTAGISGDWPFGRGTYISEDRRVSIWCNEEDHLRVTVLCSTTSLNEPFDLLNGTLQALEKVPGVAFKRSEEFGYVTSCPSNLGTGMRASVMVCLPKLTADETTDKAAAIAKPFGLSVRGSGGEHTPVVGNMVSLPHRGSASLLFGKRAVSDH